MGHDGRNTRIYCGRGDGMMAPVVDGLGRGSSSGVLVVGDGGGAASESCLLARCVS